VRPSTNRTDCESIAITSVAWSLLWQRIFLAVTEVGAVRFQPVAIPGGLVSSIVRRLFNAQPKFFGRHYW
jgi:hypothetical protein